MIVESRRNMKNNSYEVAKNAGDESLFVKKLILESHFFLFARLKAPVGELTK